MNLRSQGVGGPPLFEKYQKYAASHCGVLNRNHLGFPGYLANGMLWLA
jgi:hypothetical protein